MMDANQTRYHLLLGRPDWERCTTESGAKIFEFDTGNAPSFSWDAARSEVTLGVRVNLFPSAPGNVVPTLNQRRGAGQDRFGNWYWIADSGTELLVNSVGTGATTHFWSSTDEDAKPCSDGSFGVCETPALPAPLAFSGLAVTKHHYLIVGVLAPAGFVVFDLYHGGPPRQFLWPSAIPFVPFDMAPAPEGGVWILDRVNRRYWALDRTFAVIGEGQATINLPTEPEAFSAADGTATRPFPVHTFPAGISLAMSSPLGTIDAIAIESLPDASVLFLESPAGSKFSLVYRFRNGQQVGSAVSLDSMLNLIAPADQKKFSLLGLDFAFIAAEQLPTGNRHNTLYVAAQNGDQSWAFAVDYSQDQLALTPIAEYYPMREFGGKGIVAGNTEVYYDFQDRWIPLIFQKRPRYVQQATLITKIFDGKQPDCVWHRLMLDACLPTDTGIEIWSRSSNDPQSVEAQDWTLDARWPTDVSNGVQGNGGNGLTAAQIQDRMRTPSLYQRSNGTELPWTVTAPGLGTWELLFQNAIGQYLQLKIVLSGNGRTTPRISALRAYYPRFSYMEHYLPAVYRDDRKSASFVDRFLANIEGFFTSIEDRIATVQALLDATSAPADALDWLANWFGVALDPAWSVPKHRSFLRNAPAFFEARGTIRGLLMALRLTLEDCDDQAIFTNPAGDLRGVKIVEKFSTRMLPLGLMQDPAIESGLPLKRRTAIWTPAQGGDDLNHRYQKTLQVTTPYPLTMQVSSDQYSQWSSFSSTVLGFVPSAPPSGSDLWTIFLESRYRSISDLNTAYRASFASFADVDFPTQLPSQPQPLLDWYQFQGALLIQALAHQFTVFLPIPPGDAQNTIGHRARMKLAQRLVELEKPAHTTYEIRFYWAFFRLGEARLGRDSVLDFGSRAPQLLLPAVLGDSYIGSGYVSQARRRRFLKQRSS